jgi:cellulose synthase/poly-beta-1,6-N-acetylglucosamine synthase-like glycosyltransferase/peptidoglycan/xylan/chitin deacetylase (PgdA/CDA1 family)
MVIAEWLHLDGVDGRLRENDPNKQKIATNYIRTHAPSKPIIPLVNNYNGSIWESQKLAKMLADPKARQHVITQLIEYVVRNDFQGISIDFESIPTRAQRNFEHFIAELYAEMHPRNLLVSVNVPVLDPEFHFKTLSQSADQLILMAYDEHWSDSGPGPIAGVNWFTRALNESLRDIPREKMVVAIGNYGYDWGGGKYAEELTFEEAVLVAKESDASIVLDPKSLNPHYDYADDEGRTHHVWLLDATSSFNQLRVVREIMPRGIALWRLGSEDPSIWKTLDWSKTLDSNVAHSMSESNFVFGLDYEGNGEILEITSYAQPGHRTIEHDAHRNLITGEHFDLYPSPYVITRHGGTPRKVVLTFDDGPDPEYTGRILDVLKKEGIPATFFVIGLNAELHPDILQRIYDEGHEIGNHTFTHPNIEVISDAQFRLELTATQRVLESAIGRHTLLFRPPYAVDSEPETIDQARAIDEASQLGYLIVGMQVDPDDWRKPGVDEIVSRTLDTIFKGEGQVVLLHDSGGDRNQTIEAIPRIVAALKAKGYELTTISGLLGKSREEVMPAIQSHTHWKAFLERMAFKVIGLSAMTMQWLFIIGILLGCLRVFFIGFLALIQKSRSDGRRRFDKRLVDKLTISVVIPAYNEANVIEQTIDSLLDSDHPDAFEVIVVDDGSTDGTGDLVRASYDDEPRVRVFTVPNGGKAAALNFGVLQTQAEIVVALDADTIFTRETIQKLIRHFQSAEVGAVAGNAKVGNRINLLTRMQALEYITSQNLERRAFEVLNCITVVPGAVGAWRRELIMEAGGFTDLTLAEDADLTMAIRRLGYRIVYEDGAIGLTEAPDSVKAFISQRSRWMYGTMQVAWKHLDTLFRPQYGTLGFVALPNIIIFQVFFPLVSPLMDLVLIGSIVAATLSHWQHPVEYNADGLWQVVFYYALFQMVDLIASGLAFILERNEQKILLIWLFIQRFFYRQLMYYVAVKSVFRCIRGGMIGWGKLDRKATVQAPH